MKYLIKCNQCDFVSVNGIYCHEFGCPNIDKVWDTEEEMWVEDEELFYDEDEYFVDEE